uniref:Uncharacterized protein n=1 Tax=Arundo donax TaxID=35708 RepID=A0A0A8ZNA5_ARUDO
MVAQVCYYVVTLWNGITGVYLRTNADEVGGSGCKLEALQGLFK